MPSPESAPLGLHQPKPGLLCKVTAGKPNLRVEPQNEEHRHEVLDDADEVVHLFPWPRREERSLTIEEKAGHETWMLISVFGVLLGPPVERL